jgi:hypothetical protein
MLVLCSCLLASWCSLIDFVCYDYVKSKKDMIFMEAIFWTAEEVAQRAKQFYENGIHQEVEFGDNIGKMIVIDAETGEYGIDETGVESALRLKQKRPLARLFTMRVGYDAAVSFGGVPLKRIVR